MTTTIREGSVVRIRIRVGTKTGRVGVVLYVEPRTGDLFVLWGTGTRRDHLPHMLVMPRETAGVALGVTKPTYFYSHAFWVGIPANVEIQPGVCPRFLLAALRELVR